MIRMDRALTLPMLALSLAAGAIHFAVVAEHATEFLPYAILFAVLAWYQVLWPIAHLMARPAWLAWLTVVVNLGAVAIWLLSRTLGLPFGPEPGSPESVGPLDLVASAMEVVLVTLLAVTTLQGTRGTFRRLRLRATSAWLGALLWSLLIVVVTTYVLLLPIEGHGM